MPVTAQVLSKLARGVPDRHAGMGTLPEICGRLRRPIREDDRIGAKVRCPRLHPAVIFVCRLRVSRGRRDRSHLAVSSRRGFRENDNLIPAPLFDRGQPRVAELTAACKDDGNSHNPHHNWFQHYPTIADVPPGGPGIPGPAADHAPFRCSGFRPPSARIP